METTYTIGADGLPHIPKVAGKKLDYSFNLTDYMDAIGGNLGGHAVAVPAGVTMDASETIVAGNIVTVFIDGGTPGYSYAIHLDFTIAGSPEREDRRTIVLDVVAAR